MVFDICLKQLSSEFESTNSDFYNWVINEGFMAYVQVVRETPCVSQFMTISLFRPNKRISNEKAIRY